MGPGLFVSVDGGYRVHDYGVHNDREKFEQTSERRSAAGRVGGKKSGEARRQARLKQLLQQEISNCLSNEQANTNPVPVTVPEELTPPNPPQGGRVVVDGFGPRRRHSLDESPDYSQDPKHSERAERFMGLFSTLHLELRRASYVDNYERDRPHALRMVSTYGDRELEAVTRVYMRAKGDHFDGKPRTIGRLAEAASMIEEQMRREGQWPTAA